MADEVERLILGPFKEIVEKANLAIANAEGAEEDVAASMLKAAQSLAKEGERALKRIEPLCAKNHEQYGTNFVDAVKEHGKYQCMPDRESLCILNARTLPDEIAQYRAEIEDLLWDFDDFLEADEFDADKFDDLQKTSRKAAPRLMDILKRMKLVEQETPSLQSPAIPSFENPFSISKNSIGPGEEPHVIVQPAAISPNDRSMNEVEQQLSLMMRPQPVPTGGIQTPGSASDLDRSNSHRSGISTHSEPPPPPPSANPWQVGQPPPTFAPDSQMEDDSIPERRPVVSADDSPTLPAGVPAIPPRARQGHSRHQSQRSNGIYDSMQRDDGTAPIFLPEAAQPVSSPIDKESRYGNDTLKLPTSPQSQYEYHGNRPPSYATVAPRYRHERPMTARSDMSTLTALVPPPLGPLPPQPRSRSTSFRDQPQPSRVPEQQQPQQQQVEPGLERAGTPGQRQDDPGIIPVETETHEENGPMPSRKPDCQIGPHSSFYQLKGFCKGAEEAVGGGLGFRKIKRPVGPTHSVCHATASARSRPPSYGHRHGDQKADPRHPAKPPDRNPVLEYAVGARIVGIEFPPRYEGKWAIGWHDGVRGAFESDTVKLEPPPRSEVRMQGTSNMQAVARWKFRQTGGEGNWLKFNKGDVIENIGWAYTDHWCWSGTSSKHWGIFPQTHIDPTSIQELPPGGTAAVVRDSNSIASAENKGIIGSFFTNWKTTSDRKFFSRAGNDPSGPRLVID
ncbi:uncharacterized protein PG986_006173 [Apiospora aurea]|uniref:SH3 domain-containing protein n=1 Tax=Apiospora aurea TaxID=335848 RepID=A0ABR1QL41_9PEZI